MNSKQSLKIREQLLSWYDMHQRRMPWRAVTEAQKDPYKTWLSEIMLQQTTVTAVIPYFLKFIKKWPTVQDLAGAELDEVLGAWAGLGYYARARNLHKCANVITHEHDCVFPQEFEALKKLPGIGDYTAAAIRAIAFNLPANVVDGNVERVMARLFAITQPMPDSKPLLKASAQMVADNETDRPGDYAQALMDLGATICTPKSPKCMLCPISAACEAHKKGVEATLPRKAKKKPQPQKHGFVYWITCKDRKNVLLHRREDKGMLAKMMGLPTTDWVSVNENIPPLALFSGAKKDESRLVKHSFTHFDLALYGYEQEIDKAAMAADNLIWHDVNKLDEIGFPTLFKKFVKLHQL